MELVDSFELLARTDEFDRLVDYRTDRQCGTTACVTIEFRQNNTVEVEAFVEFLGGIDSILTGHGINHEEDFVGVNGFLDGCNLVHHLFVDSQTTGSIDNDEVVTFSLSLLNGVLCDGYRILAVGFRVHRYTNLLGQYAQLLDSCRTVYVAGYQQRLAVFLAFQHTCQFAGEGSLTGTLQTGHQDDSGLSVEVDFRRLATHQTGQLVMHDLYHQLAGLYGCQYVLPQSFLFDCICETFGYFVVDVGIEQGLTDVFQRFGYVDFGDFAFTFQNLE